MYNLSKCSTKRGLTPEYIKVIYSSLSYSCETMRQLHIPNFIFMNNTIFLEQWYYKKRTKTYNSISIFILESYLSRVFGCTQHNKLLFFKLDFNLFDAERTNKNVLNHRIHTSNCANHVVYF